MVASFTDVTTFEIRVSWTSPTTGYVNGVCFSVEDEQVVFPGHPTFNRTDVKNTTRDLALALAFAVRKTPEFSDAKRESKSTHLGVQNGNFPGVYQVNNPLNGSIYNVVLHPNKTYCECPDHQFRNTECKHIKAVKKHINKASEPPLKLRSWGNGKLASAGKLKAVYESEITDEMIAVARESLGI